MAAVVVPIVMRMREQKKLERRQWADGDEEGHDSNLMKQARAALTIKKFILRRSCALAVGLSYRFEVVDRLWASTCPRLSCASGCGALLKHVSWQIAWGPAAPQKSD
jgi:hypothetical protein